MKINRDELIELLQTIAEKDLYTGSDLRDHPCSLAVEQLNQNKDDIEFLAKVIKGEASPRSKRAMVLITGKRTIGEAYASL